MRVCLLTDDPDHPLLAALPGLLGSRHSVTVFDPDGAMSPTVLPSAADLYLLKAHSPQAVAVARRLERQGGRVVNGAAATELCQDRVLMAYRARRAGLPFPGTRRFARLSELRTGLVGEPAPDLPLVIKSRISRRGDLVTHLDGPERLRALERDWAQEPVVVQGFIANDGWDYKLWVMGGRVFVGLRRSPLNGAERTATRSLDPGRLPPGWLDLALTAGEVYGLRIYGVDILATDHGPVVVDVNPFPGFRGVPGAPEALAAFVCQAQAAPGTGPAARHRAGCRQPRPEPTVAALHRAVERLVAAFDGADDGSAPGALRVVSVRRKPGRGLTVGYRPYDRRRTADGPSPLLTARLSAPALANSRACELLSRAVPADFRGRWPGVLHCPRLGLTVQSFPHDAELPALAAAFNTAAPDGRLASALATACRTVLADPGARIAGMRVSPVRYKPATRCVLRYQVRLRDGEELVFYGKLHRDRAAAAAAYRLGERLWAARDRPSPQTPVPAAVPRPLALVEELGLVITETAGGAHGGGQLSGAALLRPPRRPQAAADLPRDALAATAVALAWLHTSGVTAERPAPTGAVYAARVRGWTRSLAEAVRSLAGALDRATRPLAEVLTRADDGHRVLVHGAFKPAQLVFPAPCHPVITDLDGAGQGDPALDVGYFLAYLRPPGLEYARPGTRDWYGLAGDTFLDAYLAALAARGADPARLSAVRRRAALFDAALLLKIASRRVRRVSSPRPAEVRGVMAEVDRCLERFAGGRQG